MIFSRVRLARGFAQEERPMSAKLVVVAGPDQGQVFNLADDGQTVIGRGETATFRVSDPTVSRAHCLIESAKGKAVLKDSGSRSGTRMSGKAITEHVLVANDEFQ